MRRCLMTSTIERSSQVQASTRADRRRAGGQLSRVMRRVQAQSADVFGTFSKCSKGKQVLPTATERCGVGRRPGAWRFSASVIGTLALRCSSEFFNCFGLCLRCMPWHAATRRAGTTWQLPRCRELMTSFQTYCCHTGPRNMYCNSLQQSDVIAPRVSCIS